MSIEVTDADRDAAGSIVDTYTSIGWTVISPSRMEDAIALALATAREEGRRQGFYLVQSAMDCNGIVDCTQVDTAGMVVRKVLGTLPRTADGVVIGLGAQLWNCKMVMDNTVSSVANEPFIVHPTTVYTDHLTGMVIVRDGPPLWYSTLEAALAAKEAGK